MLGVVAKLCRYHGFNLSAIFRGFQTSSSQKCSVETKHLLLHSWESWAIRGSHGIFANRYISGNFSSINKSEKRRLKRINLTSIDRSIAKEYTPAKLISFIYSSITLKISFSFGMIEQKIQVLLQKLEVEDEEMGLIFWKWSLNITNPNWT